MEKSRRVLQQYPYGQNDRIAPDSFRYKRSSSCIHYETFKKTLPFMVEHLSPEEKENIEIVFSRLVNNPKGLYALIDYLNFKGDGTSEKETYNGQGWGLLQVLQGISPYSRDIVASFVDRAKILLTQRVRNSPPDRNEQKWLKGWLNRVDTYLE
ncbi:MAG: hypothetical protein HWD61_05780 [Parachlamydiaceae bacterium]|nr:MAG: hypothetical protein HWD61_05780 [Parachlamydiaceae bacterium]